MTVEPQFRDKFVAFVDILGFTSKVAAADGRPGAQLSDLLEICGELESRSHVQSIAAYGPIICPESRYESRNLDYRVTQISDCAIISTEVSPAGVINLVEHISQSIIGLLQHGVLVRGYVTRGSIFHDDQQFIGVGYQNALTGEKSVRAFRMSESDGATPFVEVDPQVVRYIREETDACVVEMFGRMAKVDPAQDVTVLFPFQQLTNVVGGNISEPEKCQRSLAIVRTWIDSYKEKIKSQESVSDHVANKKTKYYMKILNDLLVECYEIENFLKIMKESAVNLRYNRNVNVTPTSKR